jgi:hypothetical protein
MPNAGHSCRMGMARVFFAWTVRLKRQRACSAILNGLEHFDFMATVSGAALKPTFIDVAPTL